MNKLPSNTKKIKNEIVDYCIRKQYKEAEMKFQELLIAIDFPILNNIMKKDPSHLDTVMDQMTHIGYKISDFQKSIGSLTRYAPTPEIATNYASFCLREMPDPFTDELLEIVLTINLIYVYDQSGMDQYKELAFKLIKKGIEYHFHQPRPPLKRNKYSIHRSATFKTPYTIFRQVSVPVLKFYKMKWSHDYVSIIRID
ncbi:unnamed protein product [Cunninghamella blakesleeana]